MSLTSTTEPTDARSPSEPASPASTRRTPFRRAWPLFVLAWVVLALAWLLWPTARWAYDIERAGRLMDAGLAWPTPRQAASLPQTRDQQALDRALEYLEDAARRRPEHPHAYH